MPALMKSAFTARVVWLGRVPDRDTQAIRSEALEEMPLTLAGYEAEFHAGLTRPSCGRVLNLYERNTEIRNTRQLSIVSAEEMAGIAGTLGLESLDPLWLGASVVVEGIPDFSHVPPSSRLQTAEGTTLTIDLQNGPCQFPAMTIEAARPGHGKAFKPAAEGRRGVTAWVERAGVLRLGDELRLFVPDQRAWAETGATVAAAE